MPTVCPTATLPSWQLRHRTLAVFTAVGEPGFVVAPGYRVYSLVESVWFQSGVEERPPWGT
jgi:hypothetical protein